MRLYSYLLIVFFLFVNASKLLSQAPAVEWHHTYGSHNGEYANKIYSTKDGGFITVGYTENNGGDVIGYHGNPYINDCWVLKLNSGGNIEWQKTLGGDYFDRADDIRQTADGGYIIAGTSTSINCDVTDNHGGSDFWAVKLKANGDVEWEKRYGGSKNEYGYSIQLTNDGGYILAGETESNDGDVTHLYGGRDYWVVKIAGNGNLQWQKTLGGSGNDEANEVVTTSDGGYVVVGYSGSNDGDVTGNHGNKDFWIAKLDNAGNLDFQKSLGGSDYDIGQSIKTTPDGGYIVAGTTASNDGDVSGLHNNIGPFADYWLVKLDNKGSIQWQKCYGGNANEFAYYMQLTPDGGYVVSGYAEANDGDLTCNAGTTDAWIIKVNSTGALQWQKNFGGNYYDEAYSVEPLSDGGFIVAGITCSSEITGYHLPSSSLGTCADFWFIKLANPNIVNPKPVVVINPRSAKICAGRARLTTDVRYAGTDYTYSWFRNGANTGVSTAFYSAADFKTNDVVVCKVSTGGGDCDIAPAYGSDTIVLTSNNQQINPAISINADNTVLCGTCTPITFKASITNGASHELVQWFVNDVNTGITGLSYKTRQLVAGDAIKCIYTDTVACLPNGEIVSNVITLTIESNPVPAVTIVASKDSVCNGSEISFTATTLNAGTNPSYQWKVNGVNAGTNSAIFSTSSLIDKDNISCTITKDTGFSCSTISTAVSNIISTNISAGAIPTVVITTPSNDICIGSTVSFTATALNAGQNILYNWKVNGTDQGINNKIFTTAALKDGDSVTCTIKADLANSCSNIDSAFSNSILITVKNVITPSVSIVASANNVCFGAPVNFTATIANGPPSPDFQWKLNNVNTGTNSPVFTTNTLKNNDSVYCVIPTTGSQCINAAAASNILIMQINNLPDVTVNPADTLVKAGAVIQINTTINGNVASFKWEPANQLENAQLLSPKTIALSGNIIYRLTVEDNNGCSAERTVSIKIATKLYMPNAFTPTGDGKNEIFRIPANTSMLLKEFSVYDRWGSRVFYTSDINKGWDGNIKGQKASTGVYVYFIKGTDDKGPVNVNGSFLLIR
jgi:gliding motility-associated-like protein